ncbi:MAG: hypothetical protein JW779_01780 [Candidatus Thorarchaeota archaeon]|nr:hypothetical protein [Candidatus Thorarchaeota archaeon]
MQLEPINYVFMIGDFAVAGLLIAYFSWAYSKGKIPKSYFCMFWIGCLIGATWEFTFYFLGDSFAHATVEWPWGLSGWPKKLSHSIWDGGIFMVGVWFCLKLLGPESRFIKWNWREFSIMWSWGIGSELLVEYLFNGRVWIYEPLPWNPVIIPPLPGSATTVGYTLIPQAVWVIAPIVFYLIFLRLDRRLRMKQIEGE